MTANVTAGEIVHFEGVDGLPLVGSRWQPDGAVRGTVLLLHGGGQTRHSWAVTAPLLAASGFVAITLDARGHGDSGWSPTGDYSMDGYMGDLAAVAATVTQPLVLIGASLGGMTSLLAVGEGRVQAAAMVLVDITPTVNPEGARRIGEFMAGGKDGFDSLEDVADAIAAYNKRDRPRNLEGLKKNVRLRDGRWYWHWDPAFLHITSDEPARASRPDRLHQAARKVTIPTLLVRGRQSDIVTPEAAAELLALIPTAQAVEVTAGHMVAGDDNAVFTVHVRDFLDAAIPLS